MNKFISSFLRYTYMCECVHVPGWVSLSHCLSVCLSLSVSLSLCLSLSLSLWACTNVNRKGKHISISSGCLLQIKHSRYVARTSILPPPTVLAIGNDALLLKNKCINIPLIMLHSPYLGVTPRNLIRKYVREPFRVYVTFIFLSRSSSR